MAGRDLGMDPAKLDPFLADVLGSGGRTSGKPQPSNVLRPAFAGLNILFFLLDAVRTVQPDEFFTNQIVFLKLSLWAREQLNTGFGGTIKPDTLD